ncbi:LORF2 protein, partial [Crocuta crocuta]
CGAAGALNHHWCECKMVQPLWKTIWRFLKLNILLPYNPAVTLLGIYPEELKIYIPTKGTWMAQLDMETTTCPSMGEWIKKWWCMFNGIHSAIKKKEILPFVITWMDPKGSLLAAVNYMEKDKYCMTSPTRGL